MIIDLPATTTSQVNSRLVQLRQEGGATTLGRVLTLVIVTDDGSQTEEAIDAANEASREHPCRVIVVARGAKRAAARLDAQIRVGGDAGASEVVVLRMYGPLADEGASCVTPLLLPDTPVVAWWPDEAPAVPAKDPIGQLAGRRITDSANERNPMKALEHRRTGYTDGDTDLAWTRLTSWRSYLAAALELPPFEKVTAADVTGEADSPSTELLAAWLATRLKIQVTRHRATSGEGIVKVSLERRTGNVELVRPDGKIGTLTQPGQPDRQIALHRRKVRDCLSEELRRLDADEIYAETLKGLAKVVRGRPAGPKTSTRSGPDKAAAAASTSGRTSTAKAASAKSGAAKAGAKSAGTKSGTRSGSGSAGTRSAATRSAGARSAAKADGKAPGNGKATPRRATRGSARTTGAAGNNGSGGNGSVPTEHAGSNEVTAGESA